METAASLSRCLTTVGVHEEPGGDVLLAQAFLA